MTTGEMMRTFAFEGRGVRFVGTVERPEWVAADVCAVLGLSNVGQALVRLAQDEKRDITIDDVAGRRQELKAVTEPGLYRLIFSSKKDRAERFRRWVFHEVLPEIRRTGGYGQGGLLGEVQRLRAELSESQTTVRLLAELNEKNASLSGMILAKRGAQIRLEDRAFAAFAAIERGQQLLVPDAGPVRTIERAKTKSCRLTPCQHASLLEALDASEFTSADLVALGDKAPPIAEFVAACGGSSNRIGNALKALAGIPAAGRVLTRSEQQGRGRRVVWCVLTPAAQVNLRRHVVNRINGTVSGSDLARGDGTN